MVTSNARRETQLIARIRTQIAVPRQMKRLFRVIPNAAMPVIVSVIPVRQTICRHVHRWKVKKRAKDISVQASVRHMMRQKALFISVWTAVLSNIWDFIVRDITLSLTVQVQPITGRPAASVRFIWPAEEQIKFMPVPAVHQEHWKLFVRKSMPAMRIVLTIITVLTANVF